MICINCNASTVNKRFCSRSCSASYNNSLRAKKHKCKRCETPVGFRRKYCNFCLSKRRRTSCHNHPEQDLFERNKRMICRKCESEKVVKRRKKVKQILVEEHGGKCKICGYDRCAAALHFHHLEPEHKDFGISQSGQTKSIVKLREEASKCILVCSRCHTEIHERIIEVGRL